MPGRRSLPGGAAIPGRIADEREYCGDGSPHRPPDNED